MSAMGSAQSEGTRLQRARLVDLTHVPTLKKLLERHGLAPTKKFGQHFLVSDRVVECIVTEALRLESPVGGILEVGPGPGVLTSRLVESCLVTAVEIDSIAVSALSESAPNANVLHADVLKISLEPLLSELPKPRVLVSNMPYNITGPLLTRFTKCRDHYSKAILMMQKEVGDRVLASSGSSDFGSLSVFLQSRFEIRKLCDAPAGAFFPPPKVESVVLVFEPRNLIEPALDDTHEKLVRHAFAQPRKTLVNNLGSLVGRVRLAEVMELLGLPPTVRAHQLSLDQFIELTRRLPEPWTPKP